MSSPSSLLNHELFRVLSDRLQQTEKGQIPFADFMATALYHPEQGYYASTANQIGPKGDFVTSPHMGADFGELIGEQLRELWRHLGKPDRYDLVEMGAGQGLLAKDILSFLSPFTSMKYSDATEDFVIELACALKSTSFFFVSKTIN